MLDTDKIYTALFSNLERANLERQARYSKTLPYKRFFFLCLTIAAMLIVYMAFYGGSDGLSVFSLLLFIIGIVAYGIKHSYESNKFKTYFQMEIAPGLIKNLGPGFSYDPAGRIPQDTLNNSKFFSYYNRYSCEDLVKGTIGEKPVTFAEIILEKDTGSGSRSKRSTVFKGIFIAIELGSTFPSPFWILPKISKVKTYYPGLKEVEGEVLEINHTEFQNTFTIFCTNPKLTQALLKKAFLDSFIALNTNLKNKKIISSNLTFAFVGNMIFVIMYAKNRFLEPSLSEAVNTREFIEKQLLFLDGIYRVGKILG